MPKRTVTKRRLLARDTRKALALYLDFLDSSLLSEHYSSQQLAERREFCLNNAKEALDTLIQLETENTCHALHRHARRPLPR